MRTSVDNTIKLMFTNKLTKCGNLTMANEDKAAAPEKSSKKSKWGAALLAEKQKNRVRKNSNHVLKMALKYCLILENKYVIARRIFASA